MNFGFIKSVVNEHVRRTRDRFEKCSLSEATQLDASFLIAAAAECLSRSDWLEERDHDPSNVLLLAIEFCDQAQALFAEEAAPCK